MAKKLFAIFAHPDDEAFGPAGYLTKATKDYEVHIICVTNGAKGTNTNGVDLKQVRQRELLSSASILGIKQIHFLHFEDGSLCNSMYHEVYNKISEIIEPHQPEVLLTFEPLGVSGHLDHIAVTSIVNFLYQKKHYIQKVLYFAESEEIVSAFGDYFVYMPPGYKQTDMIVDIADVWENKKKAINCHTSQQNDIDVVMPILERFPKIEYFLVKERGQNGS